MAPPAAPADCGVASVALTVVQLRKRLKDLGLSTAGSKLQLVERYEVALARAGAGAVPPANAGSEAKTGAPEAVPSQEAGSGAKRKASEAPAAEAAANGKRAKVEEASTAEEEPAAKRPRAVPPSGVEAEEDQGESALSVKYAGKDQAKSRNVCIRGLPGSMADMDMALKLLLESLGLSVSRLKIVPNSKGEGSSVAMVQLDSEEEAAFTILALDGEDAPSLFLPLVAGANTAESGEAAGEVPGEGSVPSEELERFREQYPMDERAFDYVTSSPPEVQRRFLATFNPPAVQVDYSKIVTFHIRFCLKQHGEYTARQHLDGQFGGGSVPMDQLEEFRSRFPMDARAFDYLRVAPLAVQQEVVTRFRPAQEETDYSRMVTAHIKYCMKQYRENPQKATAPALPALPALSSIAPRVTEDMLQEFRGTFPMDDKAFEYLRGSPAAVQYEVIHNFRPQAEESDFSRMVTAHIKHCTTRHREGRMPVVLAPMPAEASMPEERLEEFNERFPMDAKAFDYLKVSPPAVQLHVLQNFRPQAEETDYSRMVMAFIKFATKQFREGSLPAAPARTSGEASVPEEQLEEFRDRFPMDSKARDCLKASPLAIQLQVLSNFRPQAQETDYSKMVMAYIKHLTKPLREAAVGAPGSGPGLARVGGFAEAIVPAASSGDTGLAAIEDLAARLEQFRASFPMDERAFDYLIVAPPAVQERVISTFRPQAEETDYSKMVTAHINFCLKQHRASGAADDSSYRIQDFCSRFPMDARALDFLQTAPAEVQTKVLTTFRPQSEESDYSRMVMAHVRFCLKQNREAGGASAGPSLAPADELGRFCAAFPMDARALETLRSAPAQVRERVLSTFRPQNEERDYSRMVMAHVKFCLKQLGAEAEAAEQPSALCEWGVNGAVSAEELEHFRENFPMDERAFDYLQSSPADVQARVILEFRPQAGESDYSRMVTAHIKHCTRQAREGVAPAVPAEPVGALAVCAADGASMESLEQFRAAFPMDDRAFDCLQASSPDVQARVLGTFRPQAEETDFSRMVTAHVRYCTKLAREGGGGASLPTSGRREPQAEQGSDALVSQEALQVFADSFPMDARALDYLQAAPAEVQARVISTFRPRAEETDYSRMVTAHVKYCLKQHREGGCDAGARTGTSWASDAGWTAAEQASTVAERNTGGASDAALEQFREQFPMDDRAFDYLRGSAPEVQARVVGSFRPQSQERDYSRMVTAHVRYCTKQHREGAGAGWSGAAAGWSGADSRSASGGGGSSGTSLRQLDQFRSTYPMDDRAFDYLKVSPAEVQARVVRTFNPVRQESDYSRMVTAHVKHCLRQLRDGGGGY